MKRIPRHFPIWDQCQSSIETLVERIETFFNTHPNGVEIPSQARFYCDYGKSIEQRFSSDQLIHIITFGDIIRKMAQWPNLSGHEYKFWCLANDFKRIQEELYFKGDHQVELIKREDLFQTQPASQPELNQGIDLVYAGRLSRQKNIKSLIAFSHALHQAGVENRLHLFGSFDERYHEELGRWQVSSFKNELQDFIESLEGSWTPTFHGQVEREAWPKYDFKNPVAISLSTFIGEDFGVSLAQAQAQGWPIICSNFGGHKDIYGESLIKIPSWLCAPFSYPDMAIIELAKRASSLVLKEGFSAQCPSPLPKEHARSPINYKQIIECHQRLIKDLGTSAFWLNTESLDQFADSNKGSLHLLKCRDILESPSKEESLIILPHSLKDLKKEDQDALSEILRGTDSQKVRLINGHELNFKNNIILLKRARQVHCLPNVESKVKDFISQLFS